jgi:hypothetical protein
MIHVDSDSARCRKEKPKEKRERKEKRELKRHPNLVRMTGHNGRQGKRKEKRHCSPDQ